MHLDSLSVIEYYANEASSSNDLADTLVLYYKSLYYIANKKYFCLCELDEGSYSIFILSPYTVDINNIFTNHTIVVYDNDYLYNNLDFITNTNNTEIFFVCRNDKDILRVYNSFFSMYDNNSSSNIMKHKFSIGPDLMDYVHILLSEKLQSALSGFKSRYLFSKKVNFSIDFINMIFNDLSALLESCKNKKETIVAFNYIVKFLEQNEVNIFVKYMIYSFIHMRCIPLLCISEYFEASEKLLQHMQSRDILSLKSYITEISGYDISPKTLLLELGNALDLSDHNLSITLNIININKINIRKIRKLISTTRFEYYNKEKDYGSDNNILLIE